MTCCSAFRKLLTVTLYLAGIAFSSYAYFVEISKEKDENYVPLCEVSSTMNCTAVLTSKVNQSSCVHNLLLKQLVPKFLFRLAIGHS